MRPKTDRQQLAELISTLKDMGTDAEAAEEFVKHDRKQAIRLLSKILMKGVQPDAGQSKVTA